MRGPKHSVKKGTTPVLSVQEARTLLDSIDVSTVAGLRDRALIAVMVYTFARVGAVVQMKVEHVYIQGRRHWVRLHEKGGKINQMPCHHNLEEYLLSYIDHADLKDDPKGPLFRTLARGTGGNLTGNPMDQSAVFVMIRRRAKQPASKPKLGATASVRLASRLT